MKVGIVMDYIPDPAIITKEVVLTRDSYVDRWLDSLAKAGAEPTKYVPWKDAKVVETYRHRFGHRVKLIPVSSRLTGAAREQRITGKSSRLYRLEFVAFTLNLLRELGRDREDVLHYTNYFAADFALSPALSLRAPVVTWCTGGGVPQGRGKWVWFFALRLAFKRAKLVMIGEYPERVATLRWLLKNDTRKMKDFEILRVNRELFKPGDMGSARDSLGYQKDATHIICIQSLIPLPHAEKEMRQPFLLLETLAEALKPDPQSKVILTIIGTGPGLEALRQHASRLGLSDKVRFVGRVEHEKLGQYFASADVTFVPYRLEALNESHALAESFACGRPAIGFMRYAGLKFEQPAGYLISDDPSEGGPQLREALADREMLRKKGKAALEASPRYDLKRAGDELLKCYSEAI